MRLAVSRRRAYTNISDAILLHFAFNAGSYLMTLLWFVNTPFDVVVTVAIAGFVLVEAMRSLRQACQTDRPYQQA